MATGFTVYTLPCVNSSAHRMKPSQESYVPSHPDFFVDFSPGNFSSCLRTRKAFETGDLVTKLEGLTRAPKMYTSVQCGEGLEDHVELNSDFVYVNHSCDPNVAFNFSSADPSDWHIRALKSIGIGAAVTFFYPSTEWDMAQPFDCHCGASSCLGTIKGAAHLSIEELNSRGFVNKWILELVAKREGYTQNIVVGDGPAQVKANGKCLNCGYGFSIDEDSERCGCKPTTML